MRVGMELLLYQCILISCPLDALLSQLFMGVDMELLLYQSILISNPLDGLLSVIHEGWYGVASISVHPHFMPT